MSANIVEYQRIFVQRIVAADELVTIMLSPRISLTPLTLNQYIAVATVFDSRRH
jgi:hypothetical protein